MASPQKENGYIPISNELWEALTRTRLPDEARRVLGAIMRMTYGFQKKEDTIATSQIVKMTGLSRRSVERGRKKLKTMNMIGTVKTDGTVKNVGTNLLRYSIQKNYDKWVVPSKMTVPSKSVVGVPSRMRYSKDNIQKTYPPTPQRRETWLTPYFKKWQEILGGEMPAPQAARYLRPLELANGREKTIVHLENYLKSVDVRYGVNLAKFSETFGQWNEVRPPTTWARPQADHNAGGTGKVVL